MSHVLMKQIVALAPSNQSHSAGLFKDHGLRGLKQTGTSCCSWLNHTTQNEPHCLLTVGARCWCRVQKDKASPWTTSGPKCVEELHGFDCWSQTASNTPYGKIPQTQGAHKVYVKDSAMNPATHNTKHTYTMESKHVSLSGWRNPSAHNHHRMWSLHSFPITMPVHERKSATKPTQENSPAQNKWQIGPPQS